MSRKSGWYIEIVPDSRLAKPKFTVDGELCYRSRIRDFIPDKVMVRFPMLRRSVS